MAEMWQDMVSRSSELIGGFLPSLLGALTILVVGWVLALLASALVRKGLKQVTTDSPVTQNLLFRYSWGS
jgi:hypothetical protein